MSASRLTTAHTRPRARSPAAGPAVPPAFPPAPGLPRKTPADAGPAPHTDHESAALAAALHPIITIDFRGIIQSASNSVERVFGWTPDELVGRNVSVLMPEPRRSEHDGYLNRYRETGRTNILNQPRRFEAVRKDGTIFPMELSVSRADVSIAGESRAGGAGAGGAALFVGIIRDMSEQAASEQGQELDRARLQGLVTEQTQALQGAHLRLRMADRLASIGTLAAGLGHDMNNVLLPVRAHLNALRAAGASGGIPPAAGRHVEEICKSIAYLQQLADGLHFLAMDPEDENAAESGPGGAGPTDVRAWWSQTGALLSKAVPKHVRVTASIPHGLPEVAVAPHRLTQAVLNLVVNAGEALPAVRKRRQGRVRVWAESSADAKSVRLGVTDNGRGMTDEVKRRAFEMFFTTKTRGLGTGLGLALVHKVAIGAGGEVQVESEPDRGTTVVMVLPVARSARAAASDRPVALVSVRGGRAAALIGQVLTAAGASLDNGEDWLRADILVVDPADKSLRKARAWRKATPGGRLVILGPPNERSRGAWNLLEPFVIQDRNDFDAVRAAIGRAMAAR